MYATQNRFRDVQFFVRNGPKMPSTTLFVRVFFHAWCYGEAKLQGSLLQTENFSESEMHGGICSLLAGAFVLWQGQQCDTVVELSTVPLKHEYRKTQWQ